MRVSEVIITAIKLDSGQRVAIWHGGRKAAEKQLAKLAMALEGEYDELTVEDNEQGKVLR